MILSRRKIYSLWEPRFGRQLARLHLINQWAWLSLAVQGVVLIDISKAGVLSSSWVGLVIRLMLLALMFATLLFSMKLVAVRYRTVSELVGIPIKPGDYPPRDEEAFRRWMRIQQDRLR